MTKKGTKKYGMSYRQSYPRKRFNCLKGITEVLTFINWRNSASDDIIG